MRRLLAISTFIAASGGATKHGSLALPRKWSPFWTSAEGG